MDTRGWALVATGFGCIVIVALVVWSQVRQTRTGDTRPRPDAIDIEDIRPFPVPPTEDPSPEFAAEWATLEAAVLAEDPGAMARVRAFVDAHTDVHPPPPSLLSARSIATLVDVRDAARSLRAGRRAP